MIRFNPVRFQAYNQPKHVEPKQEETKTLSWGQDIEIDNPETPL